MNEPMAGGRYLGQQRQGFDCSSLEHFRAGFDLRASCVAFREQLDAGREIRLLVNELCHAEAALALRNEVVCAVRRGHIADHAREHANLV